MKRVFDVLNQTIQKSSITDFRNFLNGQQGVTKWILASDYCIKDKKKPNDVLSFVLFPYVLYLNDWQDLINKLQKEDIKHTKEISDEFCKFTKSGLIFTFSFILDREGNCFDAWNNKSALLQMVDSYIKMIDSWIVNKPHNKEHYSELQKSLKLLRTNMNANSFNTPLLAETVITCFLASYIKYLLFSEVNVEIFSWLPDRDSMTSFSKGVYGHLYEIISYCLCDTELAEERKYIAEQVKDCLPDDPNNNMFYDELVRVPDYFSGIIADYNMKDNAVSGEKQCKGVEQILADNKFLSIILANKTGFARVGHYLKQTED